MKKIFVLTGAGISAESGIATFRDAGGLWEGHDIREVASPEGWQSNPTLVLDFYNKRRKQALTAEPNEGHKALKKLEEKYEVTIVTQNIDHLHEKAGSSNIIHLHGEIFKSRSSVDASLIYPLTGDLKQGDVCEKGSQLRPHIVWFGEEVPLMYDAMMAARNTDIFIVVGTSLQVYPAAGLLDDVAETTFIYMIDPNMPTVTKRKNLTLIHSTGTIGLPRLVTELLANA